MNEEGIARLVDLARMLVAMDDVDEVRANLSMTLLAVAYLTERTPKQVTADLMRAVPSDEEWEENYLPFFDEGG